MTHVRISESLEDFKELVINLAHDAHLMFPNGEPKEKFIWALTFIQNFKLNESQVEQLIAIFPNLKTESNCRIRFAQHVWRTFFKEDVDISDLLEPVEDEDVTRANELQEIVIHSDMCSAVQFSEGATMPTILESMEDDEEPTEGNADCLESKENHTDNESVPQPKQRMSRKTSDTLKTSRRRCKTTTNEVV